MFKVLFFTLKFYYSYVLILLSPFYEFNKMHIFQIDKLFAFIPHWLLFLWYQTSGWTALSKMHSFFLDFFRRVLLYFLINIFFFKLNYL